MHRHQENTERTSKCHPLFLFVLPSIWKGAIRAILLHVHAKEAHIYPVDFLKCKKCFGSVR